MAFKYINPGYANLLDTDTGTSVEGAKYSKTGTAFWQPKAKCGIVLTEPLTELYGKFDVYLHHESNSSIDDVDIRILTDGRHGAGVQKNYGDWILCGYISHSAEIYIRKYADAPEAFKAATHLKLENINTVYFHIKQDAGTKKGEINLWVNGVKIGTEQRDNVDLRNSKMIEIVSTKKYGLLSNIILSDTVIDPREQVILLPSTTVETTMEDSGNGMYTATSPGQMLLQTVDTAALAATYGEESQVTGIALVGNPAYRTAEGLCALTALEKNGETVTEYGRHVLKEQPPGGIVDSRAVSLRLAELTGRKFGWKAGE